MMTKYLATEALPDACELRLLLALMVWAAAKTLCSTVHFVFLFLCVFCFFILYASTSVRALYCMVRAEQFRNELDGRTDPGPMMHRFGDRWQQFVTSSTLDVA